jgi:hypothetical protein
MDFREETVVPEQELRGKGLLAGQQMEVLVTGPLEVEVALAE